MFSFYEMERSINALVISGVMYCAVNGQTA